MPCRRCSDCGINFPDNYRKFKKCLGCGGKTDGFSTEEADADYLKKAFDVYFKQWDEDRAAREKEAEKSAEQAALEADDALTAELEAAIAKTPSIPDPDPEPPKDEQPEGD